LKVFATSKDNSFVAVFSVLRMNIYHKQFSKVAVNNEINLLPLTSNIIDGSNSETYNQLYFVGTGKTYVRKSDSAASIEVKSSGNFYQNQNPVGKEFRDILDGGDSSKGSQFLAPVVGGVFPTRKSGI
jgi:hypothetical protein